MCFCCCSNCCDVVIAFVGPALCVEFCHKQYQIVVDTNASQVKVTISIVIGLAELVKKISTARGI